jgi:NADPH:quinone reductase-like Zn-dependent oxidoreductase
MEGAAAAAEVASPIAAPAPPAETKQKILVLGATGPTGISTIQIALQRGHSVVAYVRNPGKLPTEIHEDDRVTVR